MAAERRAGDSFHCRIHWESFVKEGPRASVLEARVQGRSKGGGGGGSGSDGPPFLVANVIQFKHIQEISTKITFF